MDWLRSSIRFLWPELLLEGARWRQLWEQDERDKFRKVALVFFVLAGIGYVCHYYLLDIPNRLEPVENWFFFRFCAAALCFACAVFYAHGLSRRVSWYRLPAVLVMAIGCYAQSVVSLAAPLLAPWFYSFAFAFGGVLILQMSAIKSLIFIVPVMVSFYPALSDAGVAMDSLVSATFFMALVAVVARSSYAFEIQAFELTQERDAQQEQILNLQREFATRLRSFIPRVISERIQTRIDLDKMSVLEASVDVLTAKKQEVACLFSDIRGFTQGSKELDTFLAESVLPEVKACSDAIERYEGIPRKIGDLIFAYFDDEQPEKNVLRAILAGITLARINADVNATVSSVEVKRYILISSGDAIVGNVGGLNSGVEITALGSPVNFLSRLDDATKVAGLSRSLQPGDLVVTSSIFETVERACPHVEITRIDLSCVDVTIRDFPEVEAVFIIKPTNDNFAAVARAI